MKIFNSFKSILSSSMDKKKVLVVIWGLFLFPAVLPASKLPPEWILDATINNVDFYHLITECGGKKVVFLKFNNKNSKSVKVSWKEVFVTQEVDAEKKESSSRVKQLVLLPGETSESDCENIKLQELLARPDQVTPVYQVKIKNFSFREIKVTK